MHPAIQALLRLQSTDREIYRVQDELERLPRELEEREAKLAELESRSGARDTEAKSLRLRVKDVEETVTGLRARQRKLEQECASQRVDAALLAAYQHEIRTVKGTISEAEDEGLKMLEQAQERSAEAEQLRAKHAEELPVFKVFAGNVQSELEAARRRLAKLEEERSGIEESEIPADQLSLYQGLLERRDGEAMAELASLVCQGCFVSIPRNLYVRIMRGTELVQCPACNRILYCHD